MDWLNTTSRACPTHPVFPHFPIPLLPYVMYNEPCFCPSCPVQLPSLASWVYIVMCVCVVFSDAVPILLWGRVLHQIGLPFQDQNPKAQLDGGRDQNQPQLPRTALQVPSPAGPPRLQDPPARQAPHRPLPPTKRSRRARWIQNGKQQPS